MSIKALQMADSLVEARPNGQPKVIWTEPLPKYPMTELVQTQTAATPVPAPGSL